MDKVMTKYCIPFYKGYLTIEEEDKILYSIQYTNKCSYKIIERWYSDITEKLYSYLEGRYIDFKDIKIVYKVGNEFYHKIWNITRNIPYGEVRSYGWIADKIGGRVYSRLVGKALSKNPILIIVPCHRVIYSDGRLGGFSSGVELKKYLLEIEGFKIHKNKIYI